MSNGIVSWGLFSTLKYTDDAIVSEFYTTVANQELILFLDKNGIQQYCNSVTVRADDTDIYFTPVTRKENPSTYSYINEPVFICPLGESISLSGVSLMGVKLSNDLGAKVMVVGTTC